MHVATQRLAQSAELALAARAHRKNPNTMQEYAMRTDKRTTLIARNDLLKLLTDDEVATIKRNAQEYVDRAAIYSRQL